MPCKAWLSLALSSAVRFFFRVSVRCCARLSGQALRGTWPAGHALSIGAASADKDGTLRSRFVAVCCVGESGVPVVRSRLLRAAAHGRV